MTFIKQTLKNTASLMLAVWIIGSAYAAISTVSSGDPLTAGSWNQIVNKFDGIWENSVKEYVDATVSANSWGYPVTKSISERSPSTKNAVEAVSYCNNLIEGWYDDWRLPTLDEIYHYLWTSDGNYYRTTTPSTNTDYNISIILVNGNTTTSSYNTNVYTRCVR